MRGIDGSLLDRESAHTNEIAGQFVQLSWARPPRAFLREVGRSAARRKKWSSEQVEQPENERERPSGGKSQAENRPLSRRNRLSRAQRTFGERDL